MSRQIKVSFEVTDNWARDDFRIFVKELQKRPESYDIYIISNDDSSAYIYSVARVLDLDTDHVIITGFTNDKVAAVAANNIDIHLDNLLNTTTMIDETTDSYGLYVNEIPNKYLSSPTYVVEFNRVVENINE